MSPGHRTRKNSGPRLWWRDPRGKVERGYGKVSYADLLIWYWATRRGRRAGQPRFRRD